MKISDKTTDYLVVSLWEKCEDYEYYSPDEFAIINSTEQWREVQRQRLGALKQFEKDDSFNCVDYCDDAIGFFKFSKDDNLKSWLKEKPMFFLEASKEEIENLNGVEFKLEKSGIEIFIDGTAFFTAFEKYTGSKFSTFRFPLKEAVK